jgi:hypothetical protein
VQRLGEVDLRRVAQLGRSGQLLDRRALGVEPGADRLGRDKRVLFVFCCFVLFLNLGARIKRKKQTKQTKKGNDAPTARAARSSAAATSETLGRAP